MKALLILLVAFGLASCSFDASSMLSPEKAAEFADLEAEEDSLVQQLAEASVLLSEDPYDPEALRLRDQLNVQLEAAQGRLSALVEEGVQGRVGPILSLLDLVPGVGPYLKYVLPIQGMAGMLFSRPRKHYLKSLRQMNPLDSEGSEPGGDGSFKIPGVIMGPLRGLLSLLKGMGLWHSSPASEQAASS